jgi:hypothetical protein
VYLENRGMTQVVKHLPSKFTPQYHKGWEGEYITVFHVVFGKTLVPYLLQDTLFFPNNLTVLKLGDITYLRGQVAKKFPFND